MKLIYKNVKSLQELQSFILKHKPALYVSSQTSTVIGYDHLERDLLSYDPSLSEFFLINLSTLPPSIEFLANGDVKISGGVSWKEANQYLEKLGRKIKTAPTEELALVCAGVATSCTGERCFSYGNLRSQVKEVSYMNFQGQVISLKKEKELQGFNNYQKDFEFYKDFKNAPFPRLEKEIDLMIGTEGQLGVVTEVILETVPNEPVKNIFILLPRWEDSLQAHLEIAQKIQQWRKEVILCEFIDSNSFEYLPKEDRPNQNKDVIFFEIKEAFFENFYENFLLELKHVDENSIFELPEKKFHQLRSSVPRAVFEKNSQMGVQKVGTDIQVRTQDFETLLKSYQGLSQNKLNIKYNLFGHFGDCHLHFNFMPSPQQRESALKLFEELYSKTQSLKGSPFAEHGIGLLKQKYILPFLGKNQFNAFKLLKDKHDPYRQFFPQGYMHLTSDRMRY